MKDTDHRPGHEPRESEKGSSNGTGGAGPARRKMYRTLTERRQRLHGQYADGKLDLHIAEKHPDLYTTEERGRVEASLSDVLVALREAMDEEESFVTAHPEVMQTGDEEDADGRPIITITADLVGMVQEAEDALVHLGPVLFQRARHIVRVAPSGKPPPWLARPEDSPVITPVSLANLREYAAHAARWVKADKRSKEMWDVLPSSVVLETLAARTEWRFRPLRGIVGTPTIEPTGRLITHPGYDRDSGLFLDFNGVSFPPVSESPTVIDAEASLQILLQPFAEFPFAEECHRSAAIAATLTLIARYAIAGCVPLFAVRAHSPGTGKGLLVNVISMIATGRPAPVWQHTQDENEENKRLVSLAMAGDALVHIDNVVHPFGSGPLDSAITSTAIRDRLLGTNTLHEAPWQAVLFASGNNMVFRGDMARRIVPIDLDAKIEHPELRSDFTHSPLLDWVREERPGLVQAGLTMLKAFFLAGCPKEPEIPEYGSFEQWANVIRHCLLWCGLPDPCGGRRNIEAESDLAYEALTTLLDAWGICYPDGKPRTLKIVTQDIELRWIAVPTTVEQPNEWNDLRNALSAYDARFDGKRLDTKRIGNALRVVESRVVDGVRLVRKGISHGAALWQREVLK